MFRCFIFPKNTPWGIEKDGRGNNVYKNTVNFVDNQGNYDSLLRDEFIEHHLMENTENFKDTLNNIKYGTVDYEYVDETTLILHTALNQKPAIKFTSKQKLANADYAVGEFENEPGKYYFYAISILKVDRKIISFKLSLDIFFTHQINNQFFIDNSQAFLKRGHIKRFNPDNTPNWKQILKHQIDLIEQVKGKETIDITWKNQLENLSGYKWAVIYILNDKIDNFLRSIEIDGKNYLFTENPYVNISTTQNNIKLPFTIFILPIKVGEKINTWFNYDVARGYSLDVSNTQILEKILNDGGDNILHAYITKNLGINYQDFITFSKYDNPDEDGILGTFYINNNLINKSINDVGIGTALFSTKEILVKYTPQQILTAFYSAYPQWKEENKPSKEAYLDLYWWERRKREQFKQWITDKETDYLLGNTKKLVVLFIKDLDKIKPAIGEFDVPQITNEPYQFSPTNLSLELKNWEGENKKYFLPFIKTTQNKGKILTLNSFGIPANSKFWIETKEISSKYQLLNNQYLSINNNATLFLNQSKLDAFYRDSKNNYELLKKYDSYNKIAAIAGGVVGITTGIVSKNPLTFAGSGLAAGMGILNAYKQEQTREAQIKDLKNQLPSVNIGNANSFNNVLTNYYPGFEGIKLIKKTNNKHIEDMILDDIKISGYKQNENRKLKEVVNCRKAFNYVEADMVFTNIKPQLSSKIKEEIGRAFSDGIHIWHYRGEGKWKGVSNFDANNEEVSND